VVGEFFSREKAVQLPHFMALYGYLMQKYRLPRVILSDTGFVYHYTNSAGLFGIVNSDRLWATDSKFLNDPSERAYAVEVAREVLEDLKRSSPDGAKAIYESLGSLNLVEQQSKQVFVTSFCRHGDLLGQWRGYGDFGNGYALGFSVNELRPHIQYGSLVEVVYGRDELQESLKDAFSIFWSTPLQVET